MPSVLKKLVLNPNQDAIRHSHERNREQQFSLSRTIISSTFQKRTLREGKRTMSQILLPVQLRLSTLVVNVGLSHQIPIAKESNAQGFMSAIYRN